MTWKPMKVCAYRLNVQAVCDDKLVHRLVDHELLFTGSQLTVSPQLEYS